MEEGRPEFVQENGMAQSLLGGDAESFDRFVEHFRARVFHYSWLMCGVPQDAEEVAQETMLKAFQNLAQLRDPANVRAWVLRIARNVCLMRHRKSLSGPTEEIPLDSLPPDVELAGADRLPDAALLDSELRAVLDRIILELPPAYRAVVVLRDIEELSTEETARILDLNSAVVKTRLHRGRAAMREKLDCYLNNHCLEDQVCPSPAPLTPAEREQLYGAWRSSVA
jgi:RNA polymerase sigma-70 factor, ECF subfamily